MPGSVQKWVPMVGPDGVLQEIHPDDVRAATEQGFASESPEQRKVRGYQQGEGQTLGSRAKSLAENTLGQATLGVSDWLLSQDPEYRENRKLRDAAHPGETVVGQGLGFFVPGLGGVGALGRAGKVAGAIGAPVGAATKVASKVGGAVERVVAGEAPGAIRGVAAKGFGMAASGAVEGVAIGAGQALSEASIEDKELTAELLTAHVKHASETGAILGLGLGAGAAALSRGLGATWKAVKSAPVLNQSLGGSRGAEGFAQTKALASVGALGSDFKRIVKEGGVEAPYRLGQRIIEEGGYQGKGAIGRAVKHDLESGAELASRLSKESGERVGGVIRRLDETAQEAPALSDIVSTVDKGVLSRLRLSDWHGDLGIAADIEKQLSPFIDKLKHADDVRVSREISLGFKSEADRILASIRKGDFNIRGDVESLEGAFRSIRSHLKEAGLSSAASDFSVALKEMKSLTKRLEDGTPGPGGSLMAARSIGSTAEAESRLGSALEQVEGAFAKSQNPKTTFKEIWDLRRRVDDDIATWDRSAENAKGKAYRDLRGILKSKLEEAAERSGLADEFKKANADYAAWIKVKQISEQRAASMSGNRTFGITDTGMGIAGAALGGVAGGIAATVANKFARSAAGDRLAATLLNRYSKFREATESASDAAMRLARSASDIADARATAKTNVLGAGTAAFLDFERTRERILRKNQELGTEISDASISGVAPELVSAVRRTEARANAYLTDFLPLAPGYPDLKSLSEPATIDMSREQKEVATSIAKVVDDPFSLLDRAKRGDVIPSEVRALRETKPALFDSMKSQIVRSATSAAQRGRIPSYQQRLAISMLIGSPLDASVRPDVINVYQMVHEKKRTQKAQGGQPSMNSGAIPRESQFAKGRRSLTDREV